MIMDAIFMNQLALGLFLVLNLVVAYYVTKGIPKTMEDYALANRSLGFKTLVISLFATLMSADNVGLNLSCLYGFIGFLYPLTFIIMTLFLGYVVFLKLVYFRKEYTIASVMGTIYGPFARLATTLVMTMFSFLMMVGQLKEFGKMSILLEISSPRLIAGLGFFIACYTAVGGVRSVALTDVLQFVVFAGSFLIFGFIVVNDHGGLDAIWEHFPRESTHRTFLSHPNFCNCFFSAFFWSMWPTVLISPPIVQRALMTRNEKKVKIIGFIKVSDCFFSCALLFF